MIYEANIFCNLRQIHFRRNVHISDSYYTQLANMMVEQPHQSQVAPLQLLEQQVDQTLCKPSLEPGNIMMMVMLIIIIMITILIMIMLTMIMLIMIIVITIIIINLARLNV